MIDDAYCLDAGRVALFVGLPLKAIGAVGTGLAYSHEVYWASTVAAFALGVGLTLGIIGLWLLDEAKP